MHLHTIKYQYQFITLHMGVVIEAMGVIYMRRGQEGFIGMK